MITPRSQIVPTRLPSAKLYLDDIAQIQTVIERAVEKNDAHHNRTDGEVLQVSYEVQGQSCSELQDLPKFGLKIQSCKIQFTSQTVSASIGFYKEGSLWTTVGLTKAITWEAFHDIEAILALRKTGKFNFLITYIPLIVLFIGALFAWPKSALQHATIAVCYVVALVLGVLGGLFLGVGSSIITVNSWEKQREDREFRTKLYTGAIIAVISGLVGFLFGRHR